MTGICFNRSIVFFIRVPKLEKEQQFRPLFRLGMGSKASEMPPLMKLCLEA